MKVKQFLVDYALLTLGTALVAMGTYFFKFPNQFSTGGVTGIAVILSSIFPAISSSLFASVINVLFLFLGFFFLNRGFGVRTIYCSLLFSGMLSGLEWLVPMSSPLTDEKLLELFFGVILPALGSAILFNTQGSTGGTDILAMILKKFTSLDIGMALLYVDVLIAGSTLILIDVETGLFSLLGLVLKSVLVDSVIESLNRRKSFILVTSCPEEVCDFITHTLHRSATFWKAEGAYSHQDKWVVLTALSRAQAVALRRHLKSIDPHAFMLITNSSEIFGKGFLRA
ncbi:YitT family protein [Pseudoflavonifractor capillosus]|uniref:YitT family protein n=1 Tax=Pseudoflavonifractor capillosus TaxID=106588 RepID=UPI00195EDF80|nr:YitT family protein [Pseudoflavonifractor capillosus]MBM6896935.1 YitT family protein [Pseudoflavonifractor capillosus]